MISLAVAIFCVIVVSAICSLTEAAIYAVRMPFVRRLEESGSLAGKSLAYLKRNMERPISAILIINTIANTAGASIAGAQAREVLGERWMIWFSTGITAAVLIFSEILPKILGVVYSDRFAQIAAVPLTIVIRLMWPLIRLVEFISHAVRPTGRVIAAPEEEVAQFAKMSAEEGSILPIEAELVENVLKVDKIRAGEIMTPKSVVFSLPANLSLREAAHHVIGCPHSRIPISAADRPDTWIGVVLQRDILSNLAQDHFELRLSDLCGPIYFVNDSTPGHLLLREFIRKRTHLFGVVDSHGTILGVVTLEDVIESLIGREILDEVDIAVDMQELARIQQEQLQQTEQSDRHPAAPKRPPNSAASDT